MKTKFKRQKKPFVGCWGNQGTCWDISIKGSIQMGDDDNTVFLSLASANTALDYSDIDSVKQDCITKAIGHLEQMIEDLKKQQT